MTILYADGPFILICIMVINTVYKRPSPIDAVPYRPLPLDEDKFARHLSGMIRLKTVTAASMNDTDSAAFRPHRYPGKTYPLMHRSLEKQVINSYSLLYKWTGSVLMKNRFCLLRTWTLSRSKNARPVNGCMNHFPEISLTVMSGPRRYRYERPAHCHL